MYIYMYIYMYMYITLLHIHVHVHNSTTCTPKFNCSVRRHIEEGICLPVDVRLGLTRNVTIRRARH